ncbi:MAG: hypothetical protein FJW96_00795, partial [Actinobacteria bacterium]|nr:hypothetical protein [Actinomycetota bacterium]
MGRRLRRLPEPAQSADGDARAADRRRAPAPVAAHRSREPREAPGGARRDRAPARGGARVSLFAGVDHVGVGVSDVDEAIRFYGDHVGFDRVLFDWTGELRAVEPYAGRVPLARVAMLESSGATPIGAGRVKLVQVLDGDGPPPVPEGQAWGEIGVCEICLHVRDVRGVHDTLVAAGGASLMAPMRADVPPAGVTLDIAYVADPWGTKLEMIEWTGLWRSLPGPARAEGVNHVAFGVAEMARSRAFYEALGFTELLFESFEFFDPMAPWYERPWYDPERL